MVCRTVIAEKRRASWKDRPRPSSGPGVGRQRRDVVPVDRHATAGGWHEPADEVEDGGLAGAVRADDADDLALADVERHAAHGLHAAEAHRQVLHVERHPVLVAAVGALGFERLGHGSGLHRRALGALEEHGAQDVGPVEEVGGGTVEADLALLQEDGALGERDGDVHRLLDEHDGGAGLVDRPHDAEELFDDDRRQTEAELVDHEQLRLEDEGLPEREHLLLAAGEVAGLLVEALAQHREEAEHLLGDLGHVLGLVLVHPRRQLQVLGHGQGGEHALAAGHEHHALGHRLGGSLAGDVVAVEHDGAAARSGQPRDRGEQRRLAGAVGAQQRDDLVAVHVAVHAEEHLRLAVGELEVADGEQRALALGVRLDGVAA